MPVVFWGGWSMYYCECRYYSCEKSIYIYTHHNRHFAAIIFEKFENEASLKFLHLLKHFFTFSGNTSVYCLLASQALPVMSDAYSLELYKEAFEIANQRFCQTLRIMPSWLMKLCHLITVLYSYEVSAQVQTG